MVGDTIGEIKKQICSQWNLDPADIKVYDAAGVEVDDMEKQVGELHLTDGTQIKVADNKMTICDEASKDENTSDQSMRDTTAYTPSSSSSYSSSSSSSSSYTPYTSSYSYSSFYDKPKLPPPPPGLVGLNNLGMFGKCC